MSEYKNVKSAQEYLKLTVETLKQLQAKTTFSAVKTSVIDGQSVDYVDSDYEDTLSRMYVIIRKGFAVMITVQADNQTDFDEYIKVAEMTDLDYKK